jgi:hypothetical protein
MSGWSSMSVRVDQWESVMNFFCWCVFSLRNGIWCDKHETGINTPLHTALSALNFVLILLLWMKCKYFAAPLLWLASFCYSLFQVRSSKEVRSKRFFFLMCDLYTGPSPFFLGHFLLYIDTCCSCTYPVLSRLGFPAMCHQSCPVNINFCFRHLCTLAVFCMKITLLMKSTITLPAALHQT